MTRIMCIPFYVTISTTSEAATVMATNVTISVRARYVLSIQLATLMIVSGYRLRKLVAMEV